MFQLTKIDDPRRWPSTKPQRTQSCTKLYMRNEFLLVKLSALVPLWQAFSPPGTAKLDANRKIRFKNFSISVFPIWIIAFLLFLGSCSERQTILKEIRIAEKKTSDKNSDQSQLLLKIGKFALSHPKDVEMQFEYISDLFKAGYISSALNSASMLSVKFPDYTKFKELIRDCQLKLSLVPAKGINAKFSALISRNGAEEEILTVFRRIQSLDSAISKSNPKISSLFMERGKEYMQLENYSASSWDFNKAIQLDSLNSEALYNASFLNMKLRKNTFAVNFLIRYKQAASVKKAKIYENTSSFEKFLFQLQVLDSAISVNGKTADMLFRRASIYAKGMEFKLAIDDISESINLDSEKSEYYALRAFSNYKLDLRKAALEDLTKAESISGNRNSALSKMIRDSK